MITIKGVYENGEIKTLESVPATSSRKVLITFIEDEQDDDIRTNSLQQTNKEFENYLKDTNEDLYQDYIKRKDGDANG